MKVRFQADNDLDYRIVRATRQKDRAIYFRSALEAELHGKKDTAVLKNARSLTIQKCSDRTASIFQCWPTHYLQA